MWYAFYSEKQKKIIEQINILNNRKKPSSNLYKLYNSDKIVEITSVFSYDDYNKHTDCDMNFDDAIYMGIVDEWISVGK